MTDLRTEWNRCTLARGHEPTTDEWRQWTMDVLEQAAAEQVRASEGSTIPPGWKLVPDGKESLPKAMCDAGDKKFASMGGFNAYSIYMAMLDAAPSIDD